MIQSTYGNNSINVSPSGLEHQHCQSPVAHATGNDVPPSGLFANFKNRPGCVERGKLELELKRMPLSSVTNPASPEGEISLPVASATGIMAKCLKAQRATHPSSKRRTGSHGIASTTSLPHRFQHERAAPFIA